MNEQRSSAPSDVVWTEWSPGGQRFDILFPHLGARRQYSIFSHRVLGHLVHLLLRLEVFFNRQFGLSIGETFEAEELCGLARRVVPLGEFRSTDCRSRRELWSLLRGYCRARRSLCRPFGVCPFDGFRFRSAG